MYLSTLIENHHHARVKIVQSLHQQKHNCKGLPSFLVRYRKKIDDMHIRVQCLRQLKRPRHEHVSLLSGNQQVKSISLTQWPRYVSTSFISRTRRPPRPASITKAQYLRSFATESELPRVLINDLRSEEVVVEFNDGRAIRYPSLWLRDHCLCSECTHPHTKQRQLDISQLDLDTRAKSAEPTRSGLQITWTDSDHSSTYPWTWLQQHEPFNAKSRTSHQRSGWQHVSPNSPSLPTADFNAVMTTDTGLSAFLFQIRTYGLSFVANTPPTPEATQRLLEHIAFIRTTHYGGFWDFTSTPSPIDTAYTNLALPAHTDNTYFTDPCGLQLFHVLIPGANDSGQSTFVDGFAAAQALHKHNPTYYQILSQVPITSHASGDPVAGTILNTSANPAGWPVFTHANPCQPALHRPQNLTQIRWNGGDRHSSTVWPSHQSMQTWYAAAKAWAEILASTEFEIEVSLRPGMPVIFDNWRVLHGRRAFEGQRRVCGGYIGMDDFLAKARLVDTRVQRDVEGQSGDGDGDVDLDVSLGREASSA